MNGPMREGILADIDAGKTVLVVAKGGRGRPIDTVYIDEAAVVTDPDLMQALAESTAGSRFGELIYP